MYPDGQVITGEAVAVDLRLAGVGSRGVAALVDIVITTIAQIILLIAILSIGAGTNAAALITVLIVIELAVLVGYPVVMETLWRGRTVGKAAMGLRVVRDDGGPIWFRHALVRGLVGVVIDKPGLSSGFLALIPMLASSRKKRLGDFLAGTVVLQERVPGNLNAPIGMPPALAGWAASLDLSRIDDGLALRMRQFLGRAHEFTPDARASLEHQLATDVVSRVGAPPPHTPGWAVITAVLAERRRRAHLATQPPTAQPQWGMPANPQLPIAGGSLQPPAQPPSDQPIVSAEPPPTTGGFAPPA